MIFHINCRNSLCMFSFQAICLCLAIILVNTCELSACTLSIHDWKLQLLIEFPLDTSVFPLAEVDHISSHLPEDSTDRLIWIVNKAKHAIPAFAAKPFLKGWPAKIPWQFLENESSNLLRTAGAFKADVKAPLIMKNDRIRLRIALFADKNSGNRCRQLVILQESRVRIVIPSQSMPYASEFTARTWLSMIFFDLPCFGNFMTIGLYPVDSARYSLAENVKLVEALLAKGLLKRRPDMIQDAYSDDFPDFPEVE